MEQQTKPKRGGYRAGSGRPRNGRNNTIMARVSDEAKKRWDNITNKSEWLDRILLNM